MRPRLRCAVAVVSLAGLGVGLSASAETAPRDVGAPPTTTKKAEIIAEIQAAFKLWETISCCKLKFEYKGETDLTATEKPGAILVYFAGSSKTWNHKGFAYYVASRIESDPTAEIVAGEIAMNAYEHKWTLDREKDGIDIQTAVLHMIPAAIGFYVGEDVQGGALKSFIKYDFKDRTLHPLHKIGAAYTYFDDKAAGCKQGDKPPICGAGGWTLDAGPPKTEAGVKEAGVKEAGAKDAGAKEATVKPDAPKPDAPAKPDAAKSDAKKDAGAGKDAAKPDAGEPPIRLCIHHSVPNDPAKGKPYHWPTMPIPYYIHIPGQGYLPGAPIPPDAGVGQKDTWVRTETGVGNTCKSNTDCPNGLVCADDGRCVKGPAADDGCCRVSHARAEGLPIGALLLVGALLALVVRRRRR